MCYPYTILIVHQGLDDCGIGWSVLACFMLLDVVEQRLRGWETRRKKEGPKKIEVGCDVLPYVWYCIVRVYEGLIQCRVWLAGLVRFMLLDVVEQRLRGGRHGARRRGPRRSRWADMLQWGSLTGVGCWSGCGRVLYAIGRLSAAPEGMGFGTIKEPRRLMVLRACLGSVVSLFVVAFDAHLLLLATVDITASWVQCNARRCSVGWMHGFAWCSPCVVALLVEHQQSFANRCRCLMPPSWTPAHAHNVVVSPNIAGRAP
jgi:hypothetical protein